MRSGTIREQDRVVWVGDPVVLPVGSSMKARSVTRSHVAVDPIHGTREQRDSDVEWYRRGKELVSCAEAARRGIEPLGLNAIGGECERGCGDSAEKASAGCSGDP